MKSINQLRPGMTWYEIDQVIEQMKKLKEQVPIKQQIKPLPYQPKKV